MAQRILMHSSAHSDGADDLAGDEHTDDATLALRIAAVFIIFAAGMIGGIPPLFMKVREGTSRESVDMAQDVRRATMRGGAESSTTALQPPQAPAGQSETVGQRTEWSSSANVVPAVTEGGCDGCVCAGISVSRPPSS